MPTNYKEIFTGTQAVFRDDAAAAQASFEVTSRDNGGFHHTIVARDFTFDIDEPEELGGTDKAPNPIEVALGSLAACQAITYRLYAAALDIPISRLSVRVRGDLDLRGFFAVDDDVRAGAERVEIEVAVESPASDAELARLKETVDKNCPVLDTLQNPVPVELSLTRIPAAHPVAAE